MENIKMSEFSENYKNLKDQMSDNDSKVIPYLIFGIVIGRILEKILRTKKRIFKKRRWVKEHKKLSLLLSPVQWL